MPQSTHEVSRLTVQEVKQRLNQGEKVHFLDVRGAPDDFQIKGSVCYTPAALTNADPIELGIPRDSLIVPY